MFLLILLSFLTLAFGSEQTITFRGTNNSDCSCGYYDSSAQQLYTDSIIVYFNETTSLESTGFQGQTYKKAYEKGWNDQFREGADLSHLRIVNDSLLSANFSQSLAINLSVPTPDHLVIGGSIQTLRHDIHYGTFRTYMRSPLPWTGGSALTMELYFNETETFSLNLLSTGNATDSRITMLMNREFPDYIYGVNYTTLNQSSFDPWNFVEYRVDWTDKYVHYYLGNKTWRSVSRKEYKGLPSVPGPIHIKHWSTGNYFSMQGPPWNETTANVGWTRFFFNTTSMDPHARKRFDSTCHISQACSVDNMSLRGFTSYSANATVKWKQASESTGGSIPAVIVLSICSGISAFLVSNSILRRKPWRKPTHKRPTSSTSMSHIAEEYNFSSTEHLAFPPVLMGSSLRSTGESGTVTPLELTRPPATPSDFLNDRLSSLVPRQFTSRSNLAEIEPADNTTETDVCKDAQPTTEKIETTTTTRPVAPGPSALPAPKKRVDYLAGLVAVSSLLVTGIHFCLTFANAAINPGAYAHYKSEEWARKTVTPYLLNLIWIGPFLMTSSRFLAASFLRSGEMKGLAEKTVGRTPRLIIPVFAIALLEYFFMDLGATKWLEYLPSITWSTWPFAVEYGNFGYFISEIIELMYLIPNAAPQITFNYCTGVLWTVPVQLQGSWGVILGVIVVREIKTSWKRFAYYIFCILNTWYALSWGSYFWLGLMLADLDLTYKYRKWLNSHLYIHYPLVFLGFALGVGGLSIDLATQWTNVNYATYEYGIHPDPATGLPISQTPLNSYPQYFVPKLHGLVFSFGFQLLVELSTVMQKILSFRLFVMIFQHIFTIYLIHGFVFWSLGATICVRLSALGLPYWANILIVAVCCYSTIFASLPLLTPLVETLGRSVTADIWRVAHQKPPQRKPTLHPWNQEFLIQRAEGTAGTKSKRRINVSAVLEKIPSAFRHNV